MTVRPAGRFTEDELEAMQVAYRAGARGDVLVAMRAGERLTTLLLPPTPSPDTAVQQMEAAVSTFRVAGCDGWLHARRVRLRQPNAGVVMAMLADESVHVAGQRLRGQTVVLLTDSTTRLLTGPRLLWDSVSRALHLLSGE